MTILLIWPYCFIVTWNEFCIKPEISRVENVKSIELALTSTSGCDTMWSFPCRLPKRRRHFCHSDHLPSQLKNWHPDFLCHKPILLVDRQSNSLIEKKVPAARQEPFLTIFHCQITDPFSEDLEENPIRWQIGL